MQWPVVCTFMLSPLISVTPFMCHSNAASSLHCNSNLHDSCIFQTCNPPFIPFCFCSQLCLGPVCVPLNLLFPFLVGVAHRAGWLSWFKREWVTLRYWRSFCSPGSTSRAPIVPGHACRQTPMRKAADQQEGSLPTQSAASKAVAGCTVDKEEPSAEPDGSDMPAGARVCRALLVYTSHLGVDW